MRNGRPSPAPLCPRRSPAPCPGLAAPPARRRPDEAGILRLTSTLERLELAHFALYTLWALGTIVLGTIRHPSFIVRKQLKWIAYGLGGGVVPFTALYVIPFVAGAAPSTAAELTVLLQALIPWLFPTRSPVTS